MNNKSHPFEQYPPLIVAATLYMLGVFFIEFIIIKLLFAPLIYNVNPAFNESLSFNSGLVLYFKFNNDSSLGESSTFVSDLSANANNGNVSSLVWNPQGGFLKDGAFEFRKANGKIIVFDNNDLSPADSEQHFTISFLAKFDKVSFVGEGSQHDYLNFLGKGDKDGAYEYAFRQYNSSNSEGRNNRISFYAFNPQGGLGAGSYFQDNLTKGEWIYLTGVIDGDYIKIYKNGVLRDSSHLSEYDINISNGQGDFYIGRTIGNDFFKGSIDELRVYNRSLTDYQVKELYIHSTKGENNGL